LRKGDEAGSGGPAALEGVDEHCDPDGPLRAVERGERDLDAAQVAVAEDLPGDVREVAQEPVNGAAPSSGHPGEP
jgi:hypothetical protein